MCSQKQFVVLVAVFCLFFTPSFPLFAAGSCTCYDSESTAHSEDATAECLDICDNDTDAYVDGTACICPHDAETSHSLTCEKTCSDAGYSTTFGGVSATTESGNTAKLITPNLNVPVPGIDLSDAISVDGKTLHINFMSVYISGFYKYLIGFSTIAAIILIMIGGFQYAAAGGYGETSKAKERIKNAVIGLVLLMSVYLILWTVNPQLVALRTLTIENVAQNTLEEAALEGCKDVKGTVKVCSVSVLKKPSGWSDELTTIVNEVATAQGVDAIHLATHLQIETSGTINYDKSKRGPCGEIGVAQFMPSTFEDTVGQQCCVRVAAKSKSTGDRVGPTCDEGFIEGWPPDSGQFPNCNASICGNCQVALDSCAEYFDTSSTNGLRNTVEAQAKLVKRILGRTEDDKAMAMCAYNGSGAQAAEYAQKAAGIYSQFCTSSGGTQ